MGTSALATLGLLMSLYLHKPGLCQDHRASKAGPWCTRQKMLLAQRTRVWRAGGGVALCWRDGQIPRASRNEQRGQSPLLCQELSPLLRQRLEEQDEAAQGVQTRGSGISGSALPGALGCPGRAQARSEPCGASSYSSSPPTAIRAAFLKTFPRNVPAGGGVTVGCVDLARSSLGWALLWIWGRKVTLEDLKLLQQ